MQTIKSLPFLSCFHSHNLSTNPVKLFFSLFSSLSSHTQTPYQSPKSDVFLNYLIQTFNFSKTRALSISNRFSHIKSPEKPQSVVCFLQNLGFSDAHIQSSVRVSPQILFSDVDKTLKPKIEFFQDLGLVGCDLSKFISKNSTVLTYSLERKLVPCIESLKKVLLNDEHLIRVLRRCSWIVCKNPESRLLCNIAFLKSCGIVGSQLSMLLRRQPRLFLMQESALRGLISRALDMGFSVDSRMLVHGLYSVSCMNKETVERKQELFRSFGFLENECVEMFRRAPTLLRLSEEKIKSGIEFFLDTIKIKKAALIHKPVCLSYSMEERVIPRYRVFELMKAKRLLKKEPSFLRALDLTQEKFLEKFVSRFRDDAEELLVAYKGHVLDSSSEEVS